MAIEQALTHLKQGGMILLVNEQKGSFMALAEQVNPQMINFMATEGKGLTYLAIEKERAKQLQLVPIANDINETVAEAFTVSIDFEEVHTGIATADRAQTIIQAINPTVQAAQFKRPGHVFPVIAQDGGVLKRAGHIEAAVDLARLSGNVSAGVICDVLNKDGTVATLTELQTLADKFAIPLVSIEQIMEYRKQHERIVEHIVDIQLPTDFGYFTSSTFVEKITGQEHMAVVKGDLTDGENVLVRVHSECLTGDVFGSCRCDCGPQLHAALAQIEKEGRGILLYMRQEGRGIGLVNKMKAYKLQEEGYDTVEANVALGFKDDERDYTVATQILQELGVNSIRLLTNNPRKVDGLTQYGMNIVERVQIELPVKEENKKYMETKKEKLGHLLKR